MESFNLSFPIDMIKKEERIVSGIATADNIDKSGDIVEFEASLEAFKKWGGNIREMHAPIAVGKAISYEPVEITAEDGSKYRAIKVSAYISKGAQDTWEKVLDGTLKAFSIGGKVIEKIESTEKMFRGRPVNIIKQYMLGELSLVDNPANALAIVDIIKMDTEGNLDYILDIEKASKYKDPKGGLTAAGRRHFKQTEGANLKPGVKGPANTPEKMRRKGSFLTRFFTNPSGPMKDEKGRPTRLALSAAAWGEPVPQNAQDAAALAAKGRRLLERYANVKKKSIEDLLIEDEEILAKEMIAFLDADYDELVKDLVIDQYLFNEDFDEEELELIFKSLKEWFREDWVDISRPKKGGGFEPCGREDADSGKYPKCVPASRAAKMTPEEIASAVRRKRRAESTQSREDKKPIYVSTDKMEKGNVPTDPELYARVKAEAKAKFDVYPSAYANAWLVREYKKRGGGYKIEKDGEVTAAGMEAGIKNPTQGGGFKTPTMPNKKKKGFSMKNKIKKGSPLADALNEALSNTIVLYFSAHRAHWNVEGVDFREYHDLFEDIYSDTYGSVDGIAENIRKIGGFPIGLSEMEDMAAYEDDSATTDARELAMDLYEKNQSYIDLIKSVFNIANDANEQGIANFLAERIDMHEKWDWQLRASLGISTGTPEMDDPEEDDTNDSESNDAMTEILRQMMASLDKSDKEIDFIKMQEDSLQNDVNYDKVLDMNEQEINRLSLLKRVVNWLVPDVQENASTQVEVTENTQEEDMDIEVLKDALSAVVDAKLANFATSIKEEVEASLNDKIDNIAKGFEANTVELQEKLDAAEKALAETEEQVSKFADAGAIKKSVDPEDADDEDDDLEKSDSVWGNLYLPQGLIKALGYRS